MDGQLLPIPINLDTINSVYGLNLNSHQAEDFLSSLAEKREAIRTSEDVVVSKVGTELYQKFFRNYTRKQWGLDPSELDAQVAGRVPVRTNRDRRYFTDSYQAMPRRGYTRMFENMLDHPRIKILLQTDYREVIGAVNYRELIYSGPIDEFFDYRFGKLPYRSLAFRHETHETEVYQPVAVVNYPNEYAFTRITEFKHLTGQNTPRQASCMSSRRTKGIRTIRFRGERTRTVTRFITSSLSKTPRVHFVGRLGTYKYYNMDQIVGQSLTMYKRLKSTLNGYRSEKVPVKLARLNPSDLIRIRFLRTCRGTIAARSLID